MDGQQLYDDAQKAMALMQNFFPTPSEQDSSEHIAIEDQVTSLLSRSLSHLVPGVTVHEIHSAILASGAWKAAGPDHVLNLCLQQCESVLLLHLTAIFSASLQCQFLPRQWRCAEVLAIPKPARDPSLPKGYSLVSLLSCISKVLEWIVTDRLTFFLETQLQLSDHRFGFRRTCSTKWALWNFVHVASLTLKARHKMVLFSLDIQSAYNRVWHAGLLKKLAVANVPLGLVG